MRVQASWLVWGNQYPGKPLLQCSLTASPLDIMLTSPLPSQVLERICANVNYRGTRPTAVYAIHQCRFYLCHLPISFVPYIPPPPIILPEIIGLCIVASVTTGPSVSLTGIVLCRGVRCSVHVHVYYQQAWSLCSRFSIQLWRKLSIYQIQNAHVISRRLVFFQNKTMLFKKVAN